MADIKFDNQDEFTPEDLKSIIPNLKNYHEAIFNDVGHMIGTKKAFRRERIFPVNLNNGNHLFLKIFFKKDLGVVSDTELNYSIVTKSSNILLSFFSKYMEPDDLVDDLNSVTDFLANI